MSTVVTSKITDGEWGRGGGEVQERGNAYIVTAEEAAVGQKPTQHCNAIILQLKKDH